MNGTILAMLAVFTAADAPTTAKSAVSEAQDNLDRVQQIYSQSCDDRAYAAYNDLCNELADQIHHYKVDVDKLRREEAKKLKANTPAPKS